MGIERQEPKTRPSPRVRQQQHASENRLTAPESPVQGLQRSLGNQAIGRLAETGDLGHPPRPWSLHLVHLPPHESAPSAPVPRIQRQCAVCGESEKDLQQQVGEEEEKETAVQTKRAAFSAEPPNGNPAAGVVPSSDRAPFFQTKLVIGKSGDAYERQADQVADLIVSMPPQSSVLQRKSCSQCGPEEDMLVQTLRIPRTTVVMPSVQRADSKDCPPKPEPEDEDVKEFENTIRKKSGPGAPDETPAFEALEAQLTRSRGRSLPPASKEFMESRFGFDFSAVRIHTNADADHMNRQLNSLAFATGRDIFFASDRFQPGTREGDRLLAHELTHVLQQTGGKEARTSQQPGTDLVIRRNSGTSYERRSPYSGTVVHDKVEKRLLAVDSELITEAPIPNANRFGVKFNRVGFADLYKSKPPMRMSGVRGIREGESVDDFQNLPDCGTKLRRTKPCDPTAFGPRLGKRPGKGQPRPWSGNFPTEFSVGEIKPLDKEQIGLGLDQLRHYRVGFREFVEKAHRLNDGATRQSTTAKTLKNLRIPAALDYDHFKTEFRTPGKGSMIVGTRRYWIASLKPEASGVYVYFDLAKDYAAGKYAEWTIKNRKDVTKLLKDLRGGQSKVSTRLAPKPRPGLRRTAVTVSKNPLSPGQARSQIQRKSRKQKTDWKAKGKQWEKKRKPWARKVKNYLKTQGKALKEKASVDEKLDIKNTSADPKVKKQAKNFEAIKLWSGPVGKTLGKVRFLLGATFDRIASVFGKGRKRLGRVKTRIQGISGKNVSFGWKQTLIKVLIKGAKTAATRLVNESFQIFANCFNALLEKVLSQFKEEASEKLADELCELRSRFEDLEEKLETQITALVGNFDSLIQEISDKKKWLEIAGNLITVIRTGVQVIACLSPPAVGCLWGLVAQIGISVALDLVMGTQWFEEKVANPTIRDLLKKYAGKHYQSLIDKALESAGLQAYASDIAACRIVPESESTFLSSAFVSGGIKGPALLNHRRAWESKHSHEIQAALKANFMNEQGQALNEIELREFLKSLEGKTLEEIKVIIENHQRPDGKVNTQRKIPVLDARNAGTGDKKGIPSGKFRVEVDALDEHTAHPNNPQIEVTVRLVESTTSSVALKITHLPVRVVRRTFFPKGTDESTASHLRVHYKLLATKSLAPHFPNLILTGGKDGVIFGYLKWRSR